MVVEITQPALILPEPAMAKGYVWEIRDGQGSTSLQFDHIWTKSLAGAAGSFDFLMDGMIRSFSDPDAMERRAGDYGRHRQGKLKADGPGRWASKRIAARSLGRFMMRSVFLLPPLKEAETIEPITAAGPAALELL